MAPGKRAGSSGKAIAKGGQGGRAGKAGSHRKGAPKGTGGYGKDKLAGRKATPPAEQRTGHPAARRAAAAKRAAPGSGAATAGTPGGRTSAPRKAPGRRTPVGLPGARRETGPRTPTATTSRAADRSSRGARSAGTSDEVVAGRNPVVEALRAGVPATTLLVAPGLDHDERVVEVLALATKRGIAVREAPKAELDRLADAHQGLALVVAPYVYAHPDDLLARALQRTEPALLVACDGVTDPRNLGAIVRSAAAFGAHGVVVPERRSAGMTAGAWKSSAGAAARLKVAAATNLPRVLKAYSAAGLTVVGLAAEGSLALDDLEVAVDPLCLVIGSEGKGLGRLVSEHCDLLVHIPMPGGTESLNASVAAAIALHEVARRRRQAPHLMD